MTVMLLRESDLPKLGQNTQDIELYNYLRNLQEKLNYILTHICDGNMDLSDISKLAAAVKSINGGE